MARRLIGAFNAGEISPLLDARLDSDKYQNAARIMENCVPKIYGGAFGRAGMEYMGEVKDHARGTRVIEFIYSATTNFIIEAGHLYMRFWSNGQQVESSPGVPFEVVSPYTEDDIFALQYIQVGDVMYFVDGQKPVYKLTRLADDNWTMAEVSWKFPPLANENATTTTITPSGTTGSITLTASADIFLAGHVGAYFQIVHRRTSSSSVALSLAATGTSSAVRIVGTYDVFTYGTWNGTLRLQRKNDLGAWETVRTWTSANDRNTASNGSVDEETEFRLDYTEAAAEGTAPPRAVLEAADSRIYGLVRITGYTSATQVTATVIKDLNSTDATLAWSEGAWSDVQGYPRTVVLHEQRIVYGGCTKQPLTLWGSYLGDFENFKRSSLDDASFAHVIGSPRGNAIVWLASRDSLMVGTQGDEWIVTGNEGSVITATNVNVKRQSAYGSAYIQPVLGNDAVMFVQQGRRKLREFVYVFERDGYSAPDLTLLAEHIAAGNFKQLSYAAIPDPVVWAVTEDGQLRSMTFERDQSVVGWSRHITEGDVESVACIRGAAGEADEVWLVVKRTVKTPVTGEPLTKRYLERLDPRKWSKLEAGDVANFIYVDCAKLVELDPAGTLVTGLDHLEGLEVRVVADGFLHPNRTVNLGQISLQAAASVVVVGLPFVPRLQPTKTAIELGDGTSEGRKWKTNKMTVKLWKTLGGEYADAPDATFFEIQNRDVATPLNEQQAPITGERTMVLESEHRGGIDITLRQVKPMPFHVLAIIPEFRISGS
jgi:hypothetical protein